MRDWLSYPFDTYHVFADEYPADRPIIHWCNVVEPWSGPPSPMRTVLTMASFVFSEPVDTAPNDGPAKVQAMSACYVEDG